MNKKVERYSAEEIETYSTIFLEQVVEELKSAREKFPSSAASMTALTEEVGELGYGYGYGPGDGDGDGYGSGDGDKEYYTIN